MRFVELAIHGIRRFTSNPKLKFAPEATWVSLPAGGGKSTVVDLLRLSLVPEALESEARSLIPFRPTSEQARFALVFEGERERYRLVADAHSGIAALGRWDASAGKFVAAADGADAIRNLLTDELDFPDPNDWQTLYLWSEAATAAAPSRGTASIGVAGDDWVGGAEDPAVIRRQLEELLAEKQLMENMGNLQFELDGLEDQRFRLEESTRQLRERVDKVAKLRAELERTAVLADVDRVTIEQAKRFKELNNKLLHTKATREAEIEEDQAALAQLKNTPKWQRDPKFLGAVGLTVAGFVVPVVLKIYTLSLIGFAGALFAIPAVLWLYKQHDDRVKVAEQTLQHKISELNDFVRQTEETIVRIETLTKKLGLLDANDLVQAWEQRTAQLEQLKQAEAQLANDNVEARVAEATAEHDRLSQKIERIRQTIESANAAERDMATIEAEIRGLERRLKAAQSGKTLTVAPAAVAATQTPAERIAALVAAGARVARRSEAEFAQQLTAFSTKVFSAIWPNRFREVTLAADGAVTFVDASTLEPVAERELHTSIWLLAAAAVQLAAAKVAARTRSFPVVWDEPLAAIDDATLARTAQVFAKAASGLQLIVLSGRKALGTAFGEAQTLA